MSKLAQCAARLLPARLLRRLRGTYRRMAFPGGYFRSISLSEAEISSRAYESYLYGSRDAWRGHGAFQLYFLEKMGLEPSHRLLDVGCGPLRGGIHAIRYLDAGNYCGADFNESFIHAACARVAEEGLTAKRPELLAIGDFELDAIDGRFDFALAFSVLNHCNAQQRQRFFALVPDLLKPTARLYVTHAAWFDEALVGDSRLVLTRTFRQPEDVAASLRMSDWGWPEKNAPVFPILELVPRDGAARRENA